MTRPLLYVKDILPSLDPDLLADGSVDDKVQAGIDRLMSMQTPSGGFGVWPGAHDPVLWGTAYVVHLMLDARDAGYDVPERGLKDAIRWLDDNAESEPGGPKFRGTHPGYVQYVLSRAGRAHQASASKLLAEMDKDHPGGRGLDGRDLEGRYLLQAALWRAGDRRHEAALKAVDVGPVDKRRYNGWSYYSDLRRRGMSLAVFHELFGRRVEAQPLADLVASELERQRAHYFTTQELMWGVTGLGKWVADPPKGLPDPVLTFRGKRVAAAKERSGDGDVAWKIAGGSRGEVSVSLPRSAGDVGLTAVVTTEGVKPDAKLPTGSHGLSVSRGWFQASGASLVESTHQLGDLVYVKLSLTNTSDKRVENIALVDRIPAGWEIENPRLGRGSLPDWVDTSGLWTPEYMDIRDDRFQVFGGLDRGQSVEVVYAVRAVTVGDYTAPPVQAEAMYDPEIWARQGSGKLKVGGDWSEFLL